MNWKSGFILFVLMVGFASCYEDIVIIDNTDIVSKTYPKIEVNAEVIGKVQDEFGLEIQNYKSILQNDIYEATQSAYYYFSVVDANKNGTLLNIETGERKFQFLVKPIGDDVNYFSHSLITKPYVLDRLSNTEINDNIGMGVNLTVKRDSYLSNGSIYTGGVIIKTFVHDLNNPNHLETLPGGHMAIDSDSNNVWLDYYKVVYLKIDTDDSSPLEIVENNAMIEFDNMECEDCLIWKYDDKTHVWKEHSLVDDQNEIAFSFSKSGFYALAKPYVFNLVEGSIVIGEKPIINQAVDIYFEDRFVERVYTTNKGKWFTHLPLNRAFRYKIDIECNNGFEKSFNTGESDKEVSRMVLDRESISSVDITGSVRDCNNNEVAKSFFKVWHNNKSKSYFFDAPDIDIEIPYCEGDLINIQSADEYWGNVGPKVSFDGFKNTLNFKNLYSCNQIDQDGFFNFNIDGEEKLFSITESKLRDSRTELLIYDSENINSEFFILISGREEREYDDNELNIYFKGLLVNGDVYDLNCSSSTEGCGFEKFKIETFGGRKKDWIKGSFEGLFWVKSYNPLRADYKRIKADFLIKRNFD